MFWVWRKDWCRRRESNPRPRDYETLALPLSYAGTKTVLNATESIANVSSIPAKDHTVLSSFALLSSYAGGNGPPTASNVALVLTPGVLVVSG